MSNYCKCRQRALTCAGAIAATALASWTVNAQVTQPNGPGTLTFPHVIVIHTPPTATDAMPADGSSTAGMRAFIDPATGKLTQNPTPAQLQELAAAEENSRTFARKAGGEPPMFRGPGRAIRVTLGESSLMYSVARRAVDGELETACVVGDAKMREFLAGGYEGLPPLPLQREAARPVK